MESTMGVTQREGGFLPRTECSQFKGRMKQMVEKSGAGTRCGGVWGDALLVQGLDFIVDCLVFAGALTREKKAIAPD